MHSLHLMEFDPEKRVLAVRAVRCAGRILNGDMSLRQALNIVDRCKDTEAPVKIGQHPDAATVNEAGAELEKQSNGTAAAGYDLSPEDVFAKRQPDTKLGEQPEQSEPDGGFAPEAYATAMVLMALQGGNPGGALQAANTLMRATGDPEFYDEVGDVILDVFPPDPGLVQVDA